MTFRRLDARGMRENGHGSLFDNLLREVVVGVLFQRVGAEMINDGLDLRVVL